MSGAPVNAPEALRGTPGTRARSREIGYAQAMEDMWLMFQEMEEDYGARAGSEENPVMGYALTYAAWLLGELGSYAYGAQVIHDTHTLKDGLIGELQYAWKGVEPRKEASR